MADIEKVASAVWTGTLREGHGTLSTGSNTLHDTAYTWASRFDTGNGTNPEELLAAAQSGCFTMALGARLGRQNFTVHHIQTKATIFLSPQQPSGFKITKIHLTTTGKVEGIDAATFAKEAEETKKTCIISQALASVEMTVEATLE
jgi:osmotically inducible protein OsmC